MNLTKKRKIFWNEDIKVLENLVVEKKLQQLSGMIKENKEDIKVYTKHLNQEYPSWTEPEKLKGYIKDIKFINKDYQEMIKQLQEKKGK